MRITVVGLGKIGLPLAVQYSEHGHRVSGADVNPAVVALVEAMQAHGAAVSVHEPMYADTELQELGRIPHRLGASVDVAILQSDHAEYHDLGGGDFPGVRVVLDGRAFLDPARFPEIALLTLGSG